MQRVTGTNSMMTCLAPYFRVNSSSSSSSVSTKRGGRATGGCPFCSGPLPLPLPPPPSPPPPPAPEPPLDRALATAASCGCWVGPVATLVSCWSFWYERRRITLLSKYTQWTEFFTLHFSCLDKFYYSKQKPHFSKQTIICETWCFHNCTCFCEPGPRLKTETLWFPVSSLNPIYILSMNSMFRGHKLEKADILKILHPKFCHINSPNFL